jgi:hypothetical protein
MLRARKMRLALVAVYVRRTPPLCVADHAAHAPTILEINRPRLFVAGFSLGEPAAAFFNGQTEA